MNFWWLALKDLLLMARDKKALLTLILMPLILIAILGSAFGNMMKGEQDATIEKFTLGVADLDNSSLSKALVDGVFEKGMSKQIQVARYQENDLSQKIKNNELSVGIVIMPHFSSSITSGKQADVKLLSSPDPGVQEMIVQTVIEQFSQSIAVEALSATHLQNAQTASVQASINSSKSSRPLFNESTVKAKTKPVGSFQYYAAGMGVMFLLMTVVQGVSAMILEKEQEVYKRLLLSNLTYVDYLIGKMLGLFFICLLQAFIIIIGTRLIYGVNWGSSISGVITITIAYVFSGCGLGVLAGAFIKKEKTFNVAGMFGTQILAVLGGSMAPLYIFPHWIIAVTKLFPNGLALQTYLKLMSGSTYTDILPAAAGLLGLGLLFFAIGLFRLSIERRGKYA